MGSEDNYSVQSNPKPIISTSNFIHQLRLGVSAISAHFSHRTVSLTRQDAVTTNNNTLLSTLPHVCHPARVPCFEEEEYQNRGC